MDSIRQVVPERTMRGGAYPQSSNNTVVSKTTGVMLFLYSPQLDSREVPWALPDEPGNTFVVTDTIVAPQ